MPFYHARFMKTVSDSTGHEHDCCQFETVVEADDKEAAASEAQVRLCNQHHVPHWSHCADALEIETLPRREAQRERVEAMKDVWAFMG